ncbi:hypothetical protein [Noviherbaspirillum denitrificans]|uniref:Uncharacterized protein n=1 Tax=Noviherbaspirillum denitrificans TaxID=1968433 RepID=A0A254TP25_9BURK|nr:hypothetical protein [Noviherbaspirillum denitrificans]OWW22373.1 hypothetical protein AYR66_25635 [Noviherbaspirillum denitrificans]
MARIVAAVLAAFLFAGTSAHATTQAEAVASKMQFVQPVSLRGTLGTEPIQVTLRTKEEFEDGIEGDYFVFGSGQRVLLAGEIDGEDLFLEESANGTDVSGQWEGKMAGGVITGEWQSTDGKSSKLFELRIVSPAAKPAKP